MNVIVDCKVSLHASLGVALLYQDLWIKLSHFYYPRLV